MTMQNIYAVNISTSEAWNLYEEKVCGKGTIQ